MQVVIPTYGRSTQTLQHTLRQLLADNIFPTLVVQEREKTLYDWYKSGDIVVLPRHIQTIAPTRDWIIHDMPGDDLVVMMDDDLQFACRRIRHQWRTSSWSRISWREYLLAIGRRCCELQYEWRRGVD